MRQIADDDPKSSCVLGISCNNFFKFHGVVRNSNSRVLTLTAYVPLVKFNKNLDSSRVDDSKFVLQCIV